MKKVAAAFLACFGLLTGTAFAGPSACESLSRRVADGGAPLFLSSFDEAPAGPLFNVAFLYDNAAALIALIGCDDLAGAKRIGAAMAQAAAHDRFWTDGRLRNAYLGGVLADGDPALPGWWDEKENRWVEDRYAVGSDLGNAAWAVLALTRLAERDPGQPLWRKTAARLGDFALGFADRRGAGGFSGGLFGHEPRPEALPWKSTEHNADLAAAFSGLFRLDGAQKWRDGAKSAENFVLSQWDEALGRFWVGVVDDGQTQNRILALDAQIWPPLAIPALWEKSDVVIEKTLPLLAGGDGYRYGEAGAGSWTEGTAQAALLMKRSGREERAQELLRAVERQRAPGGYYWASAEGALETGFNLDTVPGQPRLYFRLPHLGATAWAALAQTGFNPFDGSR